MKQWTWELINLGLLVLREPGAKWSVEIEYIEENTCRCSAFLGCGGGARMDHMQKNDFK